MKKRNWYTILLLVSLLLAAGWKMDMRVQKWQHGRNTVDEAENTVDEFSPQTTEISRVRSLLNQKKSRRRKKQNPTNPPSRRLIIPLMMYCLLEIPGQMVFRNMGIWEMRMYLPIPG